MSARGKGEEIRQFILENVEDHPDNIVGLTADSFKITRQAVGKHLAILVDSGAIEAKGHTRNRKYSLVTQLEAHKLDLARVQDEDQVWHQIVAPWFSDCRENISRICYYGFTEIFNNAVDHSEGTTVIVGLRRNAIRVEISISDDGVGIFEKIKNVCNLSDHRHAILELSKGKLTTDPNRHTGQGIFFASRAFDEFSILSSHLFFCHDSDDSGDWLIEDMDSEQGTYISMKICVDSKKSLKELFDEYSSGEDDDYSFSRTHVPILLAKYGNQDLVSRSQAKRVLTRFERFREVFLDFKGVEFIGQGFADEIFRVFRQNNPEVKIIHINANEQVRKMIHWAEAEAKGQ